MATVAETADPFSALFGAQRGPAAADRLSASSPSVAAQRELDELLAAGTVRQDTLTELQRNRERLHAPLISRLADTIAAALTTAAARHYQRPARQLLAAAALRDERSRLLITAGELVHAWPAGETTPLTSAGTVAQLACGARATVTPDRRLVRAHATRLLRDGGLCHGCRTVLRGHPELSADKLKDLYGGQRAPVFRARARGAVSARLIVELDRSEPVTVAEARVAARDAFRGALLSCAAEWAAAETHRVAAALLGDIAVGASALPVDRWHALLARSLTRIEQRRARRLPALTNEEAAAPLRDELRSELGV